MPLLLFPALLSLTLATSQGPAVKWGDYSSLFSVENTTGSTHSFTALWVSGTLNVRRDVTYSLSFRGGSVRVGTRVLRPGCLSGTLRGGTAVVFQRATRVELHVPSRGCPRSSRRSSPEVRPQGFSVRSSP